MRPRSWVRADLHSMTQPRYAGPGSTHANAGGTNRLWGNPNHLEYMANSLRAKHPQETLHILVAKRNSGSFTYDGIELGGERVCQEIEEEIAKLYSETGQEIKRLSLVGYSLGGLVARYACGLLYSKGFFDKIAPVVCLQIILLKNASWLTTCRTLQPLLPLTSAYEPRYSDGIIIFGMCLEREPYQHPEDNSSRSTASGTRASLYWKFWQNPRVFSSKVSLSTSVELFIQTL